MQIDVVRPRDLSAEATARWDALQAGAGMALDSPFLSWRWAAAVERVQEGAGGRGVRIAVLRDHGRIVGFLPVRLGAFTAMAAGAPMCDYQAVIAEPGLVVRPRDLVRALGVGRFDFSHMMEGQAPFVRHAHGRDQSFIVDMPEGYDAYAVQRRAETTALKDLDKKRRKAEREIGPLRFTAQSDSRADFEQLWLWKREQLRRTGQTDIFGAPWIMRLMEDLFERREPEFGGLFSTLHAGERLIAAQFHLRGQHTIHAWMIAHDAEFERYSPGLLTFQDIMRWMGPTPYTRLDLGPGDYRFKRELSNATQGVMHGYVGVTSPAAAVRKAAYTVRWAAEALPLGKVSDLPGKAMRRMDVLRALR